MHVKKLRLKILYELTEENTVCPTVTPIAEPKTRRRLNAAVVVAKSLTGIAAWMPIKGDWNNPPIPKPATKGKTTLTALMSSEKDKPIR